MIHMYIGICISFFNHMMYVLKVSFELVVPIVLGVAQMTSIWSILVVTSHVVVAVADSREASGANMARVRLFSRVRSEVDMQVASFFEGF